MRYWVYDDEGALFRKFYTRAEAEHFLQAGWTIRVQPKPIKQVPDVATYGEALW